MQIENFKNSDLWTRLRQQQTVLNMHGSAKVRLTDHAFVVLWLRVPHLSVWMSEWSQWQTELQTLSLICVVDGNCAFRDEFIAQYFSATKDELYFMKIM